MNKAKLHIAILVMMLITITIVFYTFGLVNDEAPEPVAVEEPVKEQPTWRDEMADKIDPRFQITIWEAHWGKNCDDYVERMRRTYGRYSTQELNKRRIVIPTAAKSNNVLGKVSELCTGYASCEFAVNDSTFSKKPIGVCSKELRVIYRCFDIDRRREITAKAGTDVTIDCRTVK